MIPPRRLPCQQKPPSWKPGSDPDKQDYTPKMPDNEIIHRLLALNLERAAC